jgi:Fe-S oxidoreductase
LEQLVQAGVLQLDKRDPEIAPLGKLTYHDPCYLARVQGEVSAPRALLKKALGETNASEFVEVKNNGCQTKCCGAGGGRMWFDDPPEQRIGADRMGELLATDADTIAVGCPFCLRMVTDGTAAGERSVQVLDVAEILLGSIPSAQAQDKNTT